MSLGNSLVSALGILHSNILVYPAVNCSCAHILIEQKQLPAYIVTTFFFFWGKKINKQKEAELLSCLGDPALPQPKGVASTDLYRASSTPVHLVGSLRSRQLEGLQHFLNETVCFLGGCKINLFCNVPFTGVFPISVLIWIQKLETSSFSIKGNPVGFCQSWSPCSFA